MEDEFVIQRFHFITIFMLEMQTFPDSTLFRAQITKLVVCYCVIDRKRKLSENSKLF